MLRFYDSKFTESEIIRINEQTLVFGNEMWKECRNIVKKCDHYHDCVINIIPIKSNGEFVAYGYQDNEANRELRMLRELTQCSEALQFNDIFPEYKEVVICGCNELAVSFARYLGMLGIKVSVIGKYWKYFGYDSDYAVDLNGEGKLVVFAEGVIPKNGDLTQAGRRSVSPEFECIDKVYEANVLGKKINNTIGKFEDLICRLGTEQEVVILGDGRESQDAYDLLLEHGVDICGFAVEVKTRDRLLGRKVMDIDEAVTHLQAPVFLGCRNRNGALGEEHTEYFDYRGYERNKQFFLMRDYTDIPVSNLIHIFYNKSVVLAGDRRLSQLLSRYLYKVENGNISVKCIDLRQETTIEKEDIVCIVVPDYHNRRMDMQKKRNSEYCKYLLDMKPYDYTDYFVRSRSFVLIDKYLNQGNEKYMISKLTPKGIFLGRILPWSGNVFFRGIMDGHPEILLMPYSDLNENLFWYCIRLADDNSDDILKNFWKMYDEEAASREIFFPDYEKFESCLGRFLQMKKSFTSQELFVMFHIAYVEMLSGVQLPDIQGLVIYWEPHFVLRYDFSYLAWWLEDKKINQQVIVMRRDNVTRTGSACARTSEGSGSVLSPFYTMFLDESVWNAEDLDEQSEFKMRFEDVKLNPKKALSKVCERMNIGWSDNMMRTTNNGQSKSYRGSIDFDLKAVFNKYTDFLSEFDRFRISIACSPYQKRYGYLYENCLKFSRRELQEMFIKPFLFESNEFFETDNRTYMRVCDWIKWKLWEVRKHMVLDDIQPEFGPVEIK